MKRLAGLSLFLAMVATTLLVAGAQGATWTLKATPLPTGGTEGTLRGVSCVSKFCAAVGDFWEGKIWGASGNELVEAGEWTSAKVLTNEEGGKNGDLRGVSCWKELIEGVEEEECRAVGAAGTSGGVGLPFIQVGHEKKWVAQTPGTYVGTTPEFRGISCTGILFCVAVGQDVRPGDEEATFAQEWNYPNWEGLSPIPNPGAKAHGHLTSVACVSKTLCIAAGGWGTEEIMGNEVIQAGSETYNKTEKTWTANNAAEPPVAENADLYSIACNSATSCMAVGNWKEVKGAGQPTRILADIWNGTTWTVSLSSGPASVNEGTLRGVACPSTGECEAVGDYINATTFKEEPIAYIWKSEKWTRQTTAEMPSEVTASALEAVSCTGAEVCQATGTKSTSTLKFLPFGEVL